MADKLDFDQIRGYRAVRKKIAYESLSGFMHLYFPHYITRQTAPFQKEIYSLLEDGSILMLGLMAFRGSGKSTIVSLGYPIWSMLGKPQKKYIVIISQTQAQAQQHLKNLKLEFETNELLRNDYGPLNEESDQWGNMSLLFPKYGTRISASSVEQSSRGLRHGPHRPDLVIADDVEDSNSVKTRDGRNKVYDWLTGEIIPGGDTYTKYVVVGNLLHVDSLLMRLKNNFQSGKMDGVFRAYPIEKDGVPLWLAKYSDMDAIERERRRVGNRVTWLREFYLQIVPDDDQVVNPDWITYYDRLPEFKNLTAIYVGADLAISQKTHADYTAVVAAYVYRYGTKQAIYIEKSPYNRKVDFPTQLEVFKTIYDRLAAILPPKFYIESQSYQRVLIQQLQADGYPVLEFDVKGTDKRSRLASVTPKIESKTVLFPNEGAERLIEQLTGFGVEKHDDLVDSFTMTILSIIANDRPIGTYGEIAFSQSEDSDTIPITSGIWNKEF